MVSDTAINKDTLMLKTWRTATNALQTTFVKIQTSRLHSSHKIIKLNISHEQKRYTNFLPIRISGQWSTYGYNNPLLGLFWRGMWMLLCSNWYE